MNKEPLVSVCVITYNSSKYVLETLESAKKQTYKNIELIVSDDASIDNTVEICRKWIENNKSRFVNTRVITTDHNSGTSSNCNRLIKNADGEWIKSVAGDDVLLEDCIEKCVRFVNEHPYAKWVVGKTLKYENLIDEDHLIKSDTLYSPQRLSELNGSLEDQRKAILNYTFIEAPALFVNTSILKEVGGYNEKYRLLEDWPMNKKLLEAGYKCYFLNEYIVGYRKSDSSVFHVNNKLFNIDFQKSLFDFYKDELFKHYNVIYRLNKNSHYLLCLLYEKLGLNNSKIMNRYSYRALYKLIDIVFYNS
jgi:alpha-1,3-rhamnosyltransferase